MVLGWGFAMGVHRENMFWNITATCLCSGFESGKII